MWDFGDKFNGPRLGMNDGEAYFGSASLVDRLPKIDVPLLMLHSRDDPWVPHEQYERMDWSTCPNVTTHYSDRGGHMGFHHGGGEFGRLGHPLRRAVHRASRRLSCAADESIPPDRHLPG